MLKYKANIVFRDTITALQSAIEGARGDLKVTILLLHVGVDPMVEGRLRL